MSDNLIPMQHSSKAPSGFSHEDFSVESDNDGIISIPAHLTGHAKAHGFSTDIAPKAPKAVLAKDGVKAGDKKGLKTEAEDAGNAKGGDGK